MVVLDPLQDGKSRLHLIDHMGSDLSVVNDARASFEKESLELTDKDKKLIEFLLRSNPPHTSPLRGVVFKFKVKAPLFIARQWYKHAIASNHNDEQFGWNEKSFRYTEITDEADFYAPKTFRIQSKSNKQSSVGSLGAEENAIASATYLQSCLESYDAYKNLLEMGVGREQARGVLVPAIYTSWVWTVSLQATLHFIELRRGYGAQSEISAYADGVRTLIEPIVPETLRCWESVQKDI